jgi:inosine-uridine nucleoside N-ribohydrolase
MGIERMNYCIAYLITVICLICHIGKAQQRIWVDTDIRSGKMNGDMDDAIAMLMLLDDTTIQIEGISFVHNVNYADKVTRKLLSWFGGEKSIPLFKGATSIKQVGASNKATEAIIAALEKGPMKILALGPATNIATALKARPDLRSNVQEIVFCAGRRPEMVFSPAGKARFSDYNFDLDSISGRILLKSSVPITLAGYDCADSLYITHGDYAHLKESAHAGDRWMYRKMKRWEGFWHTFVGTENGFIPFDCATLGVMLWSDLFSVERSIPAVVRIDANDTQNTVRGPVKAYLLVEWGAVGHQVDYCHHVNSAFKKNVMYSLRRHD